MATTSLPLWCVVLSPVAIAIASSASARAELEFVGYIKAGSSYQFVLTDTEQKKTSGFLGIGGQFAGGKLVAFDSKSDVLSIKQGELVKLLPLKRSSIKNALPFEAKVRIINQLKRLSAAAEQYFLTNHAREVTGEQLLKAYSFPDFASVDGEDYKPIRIKPGGAASVTTKTGELLEYAP